jgi:hypothetical protein
VVWKVADGEGGWRERIARELGCFPGLDKVCPPSVLLVGLF